MFCEERQFYNYLPQTIRGYRVVFKFFIKQTGVTTLQEVTPELVKKFFFDGRTKRNWSPTTFINYRKTLMPFFKWCLENQYLQENPLAGLKLPKRGKRLPKNLHIDDAFKLLELAYNYPYPCNFTRFLRTRNHAIMATFLYCGLRKTELINLKLAHVDLDNRVISILQGKGDKDRTIPIPYDLIAIYREYLVEREKLGKKCLNFFASCYLDQGVTDGGLKHFINFLKKESGINFHLHMLRHTFATLMLQGGCDIYSLSKMMGHNDIKTTTIYLAVDIQHLQKEIQKHPLQRLRLAS